jgi:hypothetical protein
MTQNTLIRNSFQNPTANFSRTAVHVREDDECFASMKNVELASARMTNLELNAAHRALGISTPQRFGQNTSRTALCVRGNDLMN